VSLTNSSELSFVAIADLHLKDKESVGDLASNGLSVRTVQKLNALTEAVEYALLHGVDMFVSLGDLFDSPSVSERLRYEVLLRLKDLLCSGIEVYIVGGNHDTSDNITYSLFSDTAIAEELYYANNLFVANKKGIDLLFLASGQEAKIVEYVPQATTLLFSHCQIVGAKFDNERISKHFVSEETLSKFEAVFLGHFHKRQRHNKYRYVGALCRNNFNERDNPDGFLYVRMNKSKIREEKFIPINDIRFLQFEKTVSDENEIFEYINSLDLENAAVKLKISTNGSFVPRSRRIRETIRKIKNPFDIFIEYEEPRQLIEHGFKESLSYNEIFTKFVSMNKLTPSTVEIGQHILDKVFNNQ